MNRASSLPIKSISCLPTPPPSIPELSALAVDPNPSPWATTADFETQQSISSPNSLSVRCGTSQCRSFSLSKLGLHASPILSFVLTARHVGTWLALYLGCSLVLTLHNKYILSRFPFPWTLTAIHAFSAAVGSWMCAWQGIFRPAPLHHPTTPLLAVFSLLYSANIAASNASLQLVSIATHQVVRAMTPLFIVLFAWLRTRRVSVSSAKLRSLTPVILGVVFATCGDYTFTRAGLALTLLGTALAALKTMMASYVVRAPKSPLSAVLSADCSTTSPLPFHSYPRTHTRRVSLKRAGGTEHGSSDVRPTPSPSTSKPEALHPLDVLFRLSPLACAQCLIVAWGSGEMAKWGELKPNKAGYGWGLELGWTLAMNGALAFILNYVSFMSSRRAGALSMTVAANVKQVLTIVLALLVFDPHTPSVAHMLGVGLTLSGGVWYGLTEARENREREVKLAP